MRTALLLLLTCMALLAETRAESETRKLREQLAAAQAAQAAAEARAKRLETGTQRLTEAVAVQAETTKQIEAFKDKIDEAHASDQKLAETVKSEAVATQVATKKLADVVTTQNTAVTTAISEQTRQLARSLAESREVARNLKESNLELAKKSEADRIAKEESATQLSLVLHKLDVMKAEDRRSEAKEKWNFWTSATPQIVVALGLLFGVIRLSLQLHSSKKTTAQTDIKIDNMAKVQDETKSLVNGRLEDVLNKNKTLEDENARLRRVIESL